MNKSPYLSKQFKSPHLLQNPNDAWNKIDNLRPIEEIPHPYQEIFREYPCFNAIQSKILDDILYTDSSLVVSAPTGSGKTTIFELAIVRLLLSIQEQNSIFNTFKIVYVSPMKALCDERLVDWHRKFAKFGLNCILVTGDSENVSFEHLFNHNLIITTPEKWDSLTRRWKDNRKLVQLIKLFMIDEVHLLNEEARGSTLETIVCRMKTIEESIEANPQQNSNNNKIRFIAVSATLANIEDIAEWIGKFSNVKHFKFTNDYRPVKLNKIVIGYPYNPKTNPFKFDLFLNYKLQSLLMEYSNGKPTLIFCSTRKMVELTAKHLLQNVTLKLEPEQKNELIDAANKIISDENVQTSISHGIGYHHAGLLAENRRIIECIFRSGKLPILVTTSTLAMGINLPAHLVIVKSTRYYSDGQYKDYSETALMQMIGRAGRPQFDTSATALILTTERDKEKFEKMVGGLHPIESNLHRHLCEHLNAEIVLGTIKDLQVAMEWISSTFLYIRAKKNPKYYGINTTVPEQIDHKLLQMCQIEINKLVGGNMITIDEDVNLQPTTNGILMAKYYLTFETMKLFTEMNGHEILQQVLALISRCQEFSSMFLRVNEKKCLNLLNKCQNKATIRFPLNGKIKTIPMKINCVIQAVLGCLEIEDHSILSETFKIMRSGERIAKCLIEYLQSKTNCFKALLNTILLTKCFHVKLWENSPYVSKQLSGIGAVLSKQFVNAGKTTFKLIGECSAREIELILNKKPPAGNKILEQIRLIPKYLIQLQKNYNKEITLSIKLENVFDLKDDILLDSNSIMHLLVGDSSNRIHLYQKYAHSYMIEHPDIIETIKIDINNVEFIEAHFISEDWVGLDCHSKLELNPNNNNIISLPKVDNKSKKEQEPNYLQTFMDMYLKAKGPRTPKQKKNNKNVVIHSNILVNQNEMEANQSEMIESEEIPDFQQEPTFLTQFNRTNKLDDNKLMQNNQIEEIEKETDLMEISDWNTILQKETKPKDNSNEIQQFNKFTFRKTQENQCKIIENKKDLMELSSSCRNSIEEPTFSIILKEKTKKLPQFKNRTFTNSDLSPSSQRQKLLLMKYPEHKNKKTISQELDRFKFTPRKINHKNPAHPPQSQFSNSSFITKSPPLWTKTKTNSKKLKISFPLTDAEYDDNEKEQETNQEMSLQSEVDDLSDVISTSILDFLRTKSSNLSSNNKKKQQQMHFDYYSQLVNSQQLPIKTSLKDRSIDSDSVYLRSQPTTSSRLPPMQIRSESMFQFPIKDYEENRNLSQQSVLFNSATAGNNHILLQQRQRINDCNSGFSERSHQHEFNALNNQIDPYNSRFIDDSGFNSNSQYQISNVIPNYVQNNDDNDEFEKMIMNHLDEQEEEEELYYQQLREYESMNHSIYDRPESFTNIKTVVKNNFDNTNQYTVVTNPNNFGKYRLASPMYEKQEFLNDLTTIQENNQIEDNIIDSNEYEYEKFVADIQNSQVNQPNPKRSPEQQKQFLFEKYFKKK